jgi:hypothetical protein
MVASAVFLDATRWKSFPWPLISCMEKVRASALAGDRVSSLLPIA